jgi:hypothetical protein
VSRELAQAAQARLTQNKAESAGRNPDPLATIFRGMAVCGHCGARMFSHTRSDSPGRIYSCHSRRESNAGVPVTCPGGVVSITSSVLDPRGWADVRAWLSEPQNVQRWLAEWEQQEKSAENSVASRLEASAATLATLRDKMVRVADSIGETSDPISRRILQEKLDTYSEQMRAEEGKRERLLREASEATDRAREECDVREWVRVMAERAHAFTRLEQRAALIALGARMTVWRADYHHPDGWPQRYKITLTFSGFSGQAVTLPAHPDAHNVKSGQR